MTAKPRALVVRTAGANCDAEMVRAFALAGAEPQLVHVDTLIAEPSRLDDFNLIGFPGGFSYGDDVASGRVLAMKLRENLYPALRDAADRGALMIGVCNGFQVLVQIGLLPGPADGVWPHDAPPEPTCALLHNDTGRFIDRWASVETNPASPCVWTRDLWEGDATSNDAMLLPVAHGEGRFFASDAVLNELEERNQIALRYAEPVNGSARSIAGICDATGRIFALMPHPERYADWRQHPHRTRLSSAIQSRETPGLRVFRNAVQAAQSTAGNPTARAT